jgi:hypothetical protein
MRRNLLLTLLVGCVLAVGWQLRTRGLQIPDRWNPWAPLVIEQLPNFLTRYKLARLSQNDELCRAVLEQAAMRYTPLADREAAPGCVFRNAVRVESTTARVGEPFALTCRSAVSLAMWEHHVLQPAAIAHFGQRVARIQHLGSYACRNVYSREDARRSQHASADALDLAGFVLGNGRRVSVKNDWENARGDAPFLREIHTGACRYFDSVLGPDYNAAHRDHFHFDRGSYRVCR